MSYRFIKLAALVAILAGLSVPADLQAQGVGISAGANFAKLGDIDTGDRSATLNSVTGWHVHLWFDLPLGAATIRPGLRYMDVGRLFDPDDTDGFGTAPVVDEQFITFIEVPLDLRFRMQIPLITPYATAGPVLRFTTDTNNEDRLEELSLAAGAGLGAEVGVGGLTFYPEIKYTFGVTRFTKDEYQFRNIDITPDDDQRLNAVMVSLGLGF